MNPQVKPYVIKALAFLAVAFGAGVVAGLLQNVPGAPAVNVSTVVAVAFAVTLLAMAEKLIGQAFK